MASGYGLNGGKLLSSFGVCVAAWRSPWLLQSDALELLADRFLIQVYRAAFHSGKNCSPATLSIPTPKTLKRSSSASGHWRTTTSAYITGKRFVELPAIHPFACAIVTDDPRKGCPDSDDPSCVP